MSIAGQAPETVQNAIQNFETAGIKPLTRPSLIIRVFMGVVAWVERLNLKYSKVGNPPIYDKAVFPWIREIEREWRLVRGELDHVLTRIVPEPREQLGIRVEKDIYRWKEGEAVVFDDAYEHEAWNYTPQTRVVLFVDFRKPLRFPANFLNWLLLHLAVFTPFIREGMYNEKAWEKKFYAEAATIRNRCDAP